MSTMNPPLPLCLIFCFLLPSYAFASSPTCSNFLFPNGNLFSSCIDLPVLNSFLHFTYNSSSRILQIAYRRHKFDSSRWVVWGINPTSQSMVGTQAIVAYKKPNGKLAVHTSPIDSYRPNLEKGDLSFPVIDLSATLVGNDIVAYAALELPENSSIINHVWQEGPVSGDSLGMHDLSRTHLESMGVLDLVTGQSLPYPKGKKNRLKQLHGILNTISWGIMMPMGFLSARYGKAVGPSADPLWFYIHLGLQLSAFVIGLLGGTVTGLRILSGSFSRGVGVDYPGHFGLGLILSFLGLIQVSAGVLRPKKEHKYRDLWTKIHHATGYTVIVSSFTNIRLGFSILQPEGKWPKAYVVIFGLLVSATVVLEVWKRKLTRQRKQIEDANKLSKAGAPPKGSA
ncbi:hypothetical protein NMG60_11009952 [Bertholletia excelsa]